MSSSKTINCHTWADLLKTLDEIPHRTQYPPSHLYRGHADQSWRLRSTLQRLSEDAGLTEYQAIALESQLLQGFVRETHLVLPQSMQARYGDLLHWWSVMQHYGVPTRLLDWSRSPFVALYFACSDELQKHGAVWILAVEKIPKRSDESVRLLDADACKYFWETRVRAEFVVSDSMRPSDRMTAQQGTFTTLNSIFPDNEQFIESLGADAPEDTLVKVIIDKDSKIEMLRHLHEMNVHGASVFPGLVGMGMMLREIALVGSRQKDYLAGALRSLRAAQLPPTSS